MESENKVLGKINKKKCFLNSGKYGFYLTYDAKNYKIPEWYPAESMDIDTAEKLIEYKKKMSELWLDDTKKTKTQQKEESESEDDIPKPKNKK